MLPTDAVLDETNLTAIMASGALAGMGWMASARGWVQHLCAALLISALLMLPVSRYVYLQGTAASRCTALATAQPSLASCWSRWGGREALACFLPFACDALCVVSVVYCTAMLCS